MPLYILDENKLMQIKHDEYKGEIELQDLILENSQIVLNPISGDEEAYVKVKEFSVEGKSIDILIISKRGNVYIIETKLYRNSRYREAVAQVLEYASLLYRESNRNMEKLMENLGLDPEVGDELIDTIQENLENGNYNLVVVMDQIPEEFKHVMEFMNTKPGFELYALEVREYLSEKFQEGALLEIELYGKTERKTGPVRVHWAIQDISKEIDMIQDEVAKSVYQEIFRYIMEKQREYPEEVNIKIGTGKTPSFGVAFNKLGGRMLLRWAIEEGFYMQIFFDMADKSKEWQINLLKTIAEKLRQAGINLPSDYLSREPGFNFNIWGSRFNTIKEIIGQILS